MNRILVFLKHPDKKSISKMIKEIITLMIKKREIPFFKEACKEVVNAVKIIPDRFIGWDVAITQNGPIIVEANWDPHIFLSDYAYGGLLKNRHIKRLVNDLKK
ncbi:sugar-transfer associated ATP-grasp domain-containing protein [Flavivirga rizhaonensis]|uniref:Uncharacterized protein n=1 Tax=Flavivirga rizhaonensis TaxID=2559571 RepID=A0A4S1DRU9_9FLAO|nr:sugar-transfer associated ATP-grasp domain-containing protein [Flavivirga rizhaonensis]TGV00700.1 hypothetical protein EM932_18570 [Flavivirga rizhaonensis]